MAKTQLSPAALPGKRYSFAPKTAYVPPAETFEDGLYFLKSVGGGVFYIKKL
jgi:hypothetical protein